MASVHRYVTSCLWEGSTGAGYAAYDCSHTAGATPSPATLMLSSIRLFEDGPSC